MGWHTLDPPAVRLVSLLASLTAHKAVGVDAASSTPPGVSARGDPVVKRRGRAGGNVDGDTSLQHGRPLTGVAASPQLPVAREDVPELADGGVDGGPTHLTWRDGGMDHGPLVAITLPMTLPFRASIVYTVIRC